MKKQNDEQLKNTNVYWEIYSEEDVLSNLRKYPDAYNKFQGLRPENQKEILLFLQGQKGIKITYDPFFQTIFNPSMHPERLEDFLSTLLKQPVKIHEVLQREGSLLSSEGSLVIMDIIVQCEDGSYIDVEMQKIGYAFPGERTACYASDLIMRQYSRVKSEKRKSFSYKDMKKTYVIVLLEKSSKEFSIVSPNYLHERQVSYTSNAKVAELSEIFYISLDTYQKVVHTIDSKLDAWLTFLSTDEPYKIIELIHKFPEFRLYYDEIFTLRTKPEELMTMFSDALAILDHNTELYMIQELQNEVNEKNAVIADKDAALADKDATIEMLNNRIRELELNNL